MWFAESKIQFWLRSIRTSFWAMVTCRFLTFFFFSTCTHVWSILEVGRGKMPYRIIILMGNDYFNDKKYSGPIVLGDYVEKGSVWSRQNHVFCACGIVGTVLSITRRRTGLCGRNWCQAKKGTSSTTLWWTETEYSSHRWTSCSA